ncbi:hypothetical protein GCM10027430_13520 [Lysobacter tyrosinilyticus]
MDVLSNSPRRHWLERALGPLSIGVLALLLLSTRVLANAAPVELQASENRVKAAFVYKFGDYIEWPPEAFGAPDSPLVIGVVGADAMADELARIAQGHAIGGRSVAVKKLRYGDALTGLHVVFIGRTDARNVAAALEASKGRPALTITETADGLKLGSVINFVVVANKVRFDVALPPAEASRLKISSRLLAVARTVVGSVP